MSTMAGRVSLIFGVALSALAAPAVAQPQFGNASPTAGSETSQKANASADQAAYRPAVTLARPIPQTPHEEPSHRGG